MTNSEILKANFLDIIFENRNKDYGAYSLRKGYRNRMLIALGTGLSVILLVIFILTTGKTKSTDKPPVINTKEGIVIRTIEMPKEKIKEPVKTKEIAKQKPAPKPVQKIASINYTTPPKIKKDTEVKNPMVATKELEGKEIADKTSDGKETDGKVVLDTEPVKETGNGTAATTGPSQPDFTADERDPQFPGGQDGLKQFMTRNLSTPDELEGGERKVVQIKFKVDKDGSVTTFEIVTSGGSEFDREVMRVCKKMPRWIPAIQNGINVSVNYVLPVTFIGREE
ncbi:MAG: TonB family protein [Chitinophagaceae bacterium]|nr:TonB family protein [Chitinophagaceae bacterium]